MMKSIFSFFHLLFQVLAKRKTSKSVSLFLIHIGPNWYWQIRLKDFKSNICLEQIDEIIYPFLHVNTKNYELMEKYWGACCQKWLWHTEHKVNG